MGRLAPPALGWSSDQCHHRASQWFIYNQWERCLTWRGSWFWVQYLDNSTHWLNGTWAEAVSLVPVEGEVVCATDIVKYQIERPQYPVEYCLSRKLTEQCELHFSPAICLVVIVCNIIKVLCMSLTALSNRTDIFLTVGDAVASFLSRPDPSTERMGLVSRSNLFRGPQPWPSFRRDYLQLAVKDASRLPAWATLPPRQRWTRALPTSQWIVTIGVYVLTTFCPCVHSHLRI